MTNEPEGRDAAVVRDLIERKRTSRGRTLVAIAGPPGSGKSTLAEAVARLVNAGEAATSAEAVVLPMDGYHLDNRLLEARGLLSRKGAPETFDAHGFRDAVHALADPLRTTYHPLFDRRLDLSIANAICIGPDASVVVIEGNYLLLGTEPWASASKAFSATVFVRPSTRVLQERLHRRWLDHGLDARAAMRRVEENDLPNAEFVIRESVRADVVLTQDDETRERGGA